MSKKIVFGVCILAIMTALLSSCGEKFPENPDLPVVATTRSTTTSLWVQGSVETEESFEETDTYEATGFIDDFLADRDETETVTYSDEPSVPVVTPANELYDVYPMKIIYPEATETSAVITMETVQKDMYNQDGFLAMKLSVEYPVISGIDEAVCKRINDNMKAHADAAASWAQEWADSFETPSDTAQELLTTENAVPREYTVNTTGTYFDGSGCEINGNILTVYFAVNDYIFPQVHGTEEPEPVMFDLRTGDEILFSELIGDKNKIEELFSKAYHMGAIMRGRLPCGELEADKASEWLAHGVGSENVYFTDDRISVRDGCIGFYLAPNDEGDAFGSGVKFRHLPAEDFIPYLNEKGKSLFEGYVSAASVPANVIEYRGRKYFDTMEWIPDFIDKDNLSDSDREYISLFTNLSEYERKQYGLLG